MTLLFGKAKVHRISDIAKDADEMLAQYFIYPIFNKKSKCGGKLTFSY